jgi:hypothetical protein
MFQRRIRRKDNVQKTKRAEDAQVYESRILSYYSIIRAT